MAKVAIVTDSNSGISVEEGKDLGITVVPMPVHIDGRIYYEGRDLDQNFFYEKQLAGADIATSQPAPGDVMALWEKALKGHNGLVYIPMTAGLSNSYNTACILAQEYGGRVEVVDNRRISVTLRHSVMDALTLADKGMSAAEIREVLEKQAYDAEIFITVDNLKYLRKGGRVSGVEAIAGTMLNIKPVLQIHGEKLTAVEKVRGMKAARQAMLKRLRASVEGPLKDLWDKKGLAVKIACSKVSKELLEDWRAEVHAAFPEAPEVTGEPLTLSIACHTGPGALGCGVVRTSPLV